MSMRMSSKELRELADKIDAIEGLSIDVKLIRVTSHDVYLDSATDGTLVVIGITDKTIAGRVKLSEEDTANLLAPRRSVRR